MKSAGLKTRGSPGTRGAVFVVLALFAARPEPAFAGVSDNGFQFLDETLGARAAALGDASSAPGDEAADSLHNPALAAEARRGELSLSYASGLAGVTRGSASALHPLRSGVLIAGARTLDSGAIPAYGPGNNRLGETEAKDLALTVGYAHPFGPRVAWGLSTTQASETLATKTARATAFDGGVTFRPLQQPLRFAAAVRNLGSGGSFGREKTSLPRSLDLGVSWQGFSDAFTAVLEWHRPDAGEPLLRGGAEAWLYRTTAFRAGFSSGRRASTGLSLGMGFRMGRVQVDYAFAAQEKGFDDVHKMGIRFFFGGPADRAYQEGLRLAREGRPAEAILKLEEVLDADPRHPGAARALRGAIKSLEREMREDEGGEEAP